MFSLLPAREGSTEIITRGRCVASTGGLEPIPFCAAACRAAARAAYAFVFESRLRVCVRIPACFGRVRVSLVEAQRLPSVPSTWRNLEAHIRTGPRQGGVCKGQRPLLPVICTRNSLSHYRPVDCCCSFVICNPNHKPRPTRMPREGTP